MQLNKVFSDIFIPIFTDINSVYGVSTVSGGVVIYDMAYAVGSNSDTVNIYMAVSSAAVIDWGDGNTTNASSSSVTMYSHTYSSASSPSISIDQPTYVTDLEFELGSNFFADFTNDITKSKFTNLETFTMTDVGSDNWVGDPFVSLPNVSLDLGL